MKTCGGSGEYLRLFLTWVLDAGEWSASRPSRFTLWKRDHRKSGVVGPTTSQNDLEQNTGRTVPRNKTGFLGRPASPCLSHGTNLSFPSCFQPSCEMYIS